MTHPSHHTMTPKNEITVCLVVILFFAALLRIDLVTLNMNLLLGQGLVQDDAFYYYVIARNIIVHGVSSFDSINATNGFHPLWEALCLPVFHLWQGDFPVRIMLGIACTFDWLSIALLFLILRQTTQNPYAALCGAAILAFHGTIIRTWFNGLETALSIFSLLCLLYQFLRMRQYALTLQGQGRISDHLVLGAVAAIAFLARTDNAVIIVVMFAFLYLPGLIRHGEFKAGLTASLFFLLLTCPWLLWNEFNFGSIVQVSGQIHDNTWLENGSLPDVSLAQQLLFGMVNSIKLVKVIAGKMFSPDFAQDMGGYFYLMAIVIVCGYALYKVPAFKITIAPFVPFMTGVMVLFLYHAGVRHFVRGWYNAPVLLMLTLLLCVLFDRIMAQRARITFARTFFMTLSAAILLMYSPFAYLNTATPEPIDPRIATARWINNHTPTHALIGAANAGIMGYYAERRVVNLDGVVNESAFHARLANQLPQYIAHTNIQYLADHKGSIVHLCVDNAFFTCTRIWNSGSTWVMQIQRQGQTRNDQ